MRPTTFVIFSAQQNDKGDFHFRQYNQKNEHDLEYLMVPAFSMSYLTVKYGSICHFFLSLLFHYIGRIKGNTDYKNLLPLGSGSEDEADDDINAPDVRNNSSSVTFPEISSNGKSKQNHNKMNGVGYKFSGTNRRDDRCCTPTRAALTFAVVLLSLGIGYMAGFLTPIRIDTGRNDMKQIVKKSAPWRTKISDYGTYLL